MMNCLTCGAEVKEEEKFCPKCGTKIKRKKSRNLVGIGACLAALISLFLPYTTISVFGLKSSATFIQTEYGFLLLATELIVCIFYILKINILAVIVGVIHFILSFITYILLSAVGFGNMGIGMYLLIAASLIMIFAPLIWKIINKKRKEIQK